jgi:hypothetical protein
MQLAAYELFETMGVLDTSIILGTKTARVAIEKKVEVAPEAAKPAPKEDSTLKDGKHNWNNAINDKVSVVAPVAPKAVAKQERVELFVSAYNNISIVDSLKAGVKNQKPKTIVGSLKNVLNDLVAEVKIATITKTIEIKSAMNKDTSFKNYKYNWN